MRAGCASSQLARNRTFVEKQTSRAPSFPLPGVPTDRSSSVGWCSAERVGEHTTETAMTLSHAVRHIEVWQPNSVCVCLMGDPKRSLAVPAPQAAAVSPVSALRSEDLHLNAVSRLIQEAPGQRREPENR